MSGTIETMEEYPTIPKRPHGSASKFWVFDKIDGSNIRAGWSFKNGFNKFGSRKRLLGTDQGILAKAEYLIKLNEDAFNAVFLNRKLGIRKATCFFEFYGPHSFAGTHQPDDEHIVSLLDIFVEEAKVLPPGMLEVRTYLDVVSNQLPKFGFGNFPNLLCIGDINETLYDEVLNGTLNGMTFEGVVCKSSRSKSSLYPTMFKIKNKEWVKQVKKTISPVLWEEVL